MGRYAQTTRVPVDRSRNEIEQTLGRYGADAFGYAMQSDQAAVYFRYSGKQIRIMVPVPDDPQAHRQRWRALLLVIKAKLEAIESGIASFEQEFLAHIVLPDGRTTGEAMIPQIEDAYISGRLPNMGFLGLPAPKNAEADVVDVEVSP